MIYLAQAVDGGPIRIGTSRNLKQRMAGLATEHKRKFSVLAETPGSRPDELFLHHAFSPLRLHGEWFQTHDAMRLLVDEMQIGRPAWLPAFDDFSEEWARDTARSLFGSLDAATVELGNSGKTRASDVFGWQCQLRSIGIKLHFYTAFHGSSLPEYVRALHGSQPSFFKSAWQRKNAHGSAAA